jgi:hypothetical protein
MEKIKSIVNWAMGYKTWEIVDYAKAAGIVIIAIVILINLF